MNGDLSVEWPILNACFIVKRPAKHVKFRRQSLANLEHSLDRDMCPAGGFLVDFDDVDGSVGGQIL